MKKVDQKYIQNQYKSGVENYAAFTKEVGLWQSEAYVFDKYLHRTDAVLDLGCGTGRTTFPLFDKGFENIIGVDLTVEMINEAALLNQHFGKEIPFEVGDATQLRFEDQIFDALIFSFNGIMSIPMLAHRMKAFDEINRVLKLNGVFIFTTHDRAMEAQFLDFWIAEKNRWETGNQRKELYEFGDLIAKSKNEEREIFIHIPDKKEVEECLLENGFKVVETFYRSDKFDESDAVKIKSGECRFWVTRKIG